MVLLRYAMIVGLVILCAYVIWGMMSGSPCICYYWDLRRGS